MGDECYELWGRGRIRTGLWTCLPSWTGFSAAAHTAACGNTRVRHVITLHTVVIDDYKALDALRNLFKIVIQLCRKIVNGHAATIPSHVFLIVANTVK